MIQASHKVSASNLKDIFIFALLLRQWITCTMAVSEHEFQNHYSQIVAVGLDDLWRSLPTELYVSKYSRNKNSFEKMEALCHPEQTCLHTVWKMFFTPAEIMGVSLRCQEVLIIVPDATAKEELWFSQHVIQMPHEVETTKPVSCKETWLENRKMFMNMDPLHLQWWQLFTSLTFLLKTSESQNGLKFKYDLCPLS